AVCDAEGVEAILFCMRMGVGDLGIYRFRLSSRTRTHLYAPKTSVVRGKMTQPCRRMVAVEAHVIRTSYETSKISTVPGKIQNAVTRSDREEGRRMVAFHAHVTKLTGLVWSPARAYHTISPRHRS
ncbi:unnamed protein product, partial [Scytosiphon promiscuus]